MKKFGITFMALGIIVMIVGCLIWPNLNHSNAVDSHSWTIYINGYKSFRWPVFLGGIIFVIGALDAVTWNTPKGRRMP
jgi:hypothetical protein